MYLYPSVVDSLALTHTHTLFPTENYWKKERVLVVGDLKTCDNYNITRNKRITLLKPYDRIRIIRHTRELGIYLD